LGTKELQKNLIEKFKIELPYMRVFNGKQHAMESIYGNWHDLVFVESEESWTWFLQNLYRAIAHPNGLVIHTDSCKGLEVAVDNVFPGVENRECMRHLAANFGKNSKERCMPTICDQHLSLAV
jgi:hypothetical protein